MGSPIIGPYGEVLVDGDLVTPGDEGKPFSYDQGGYYPCDLNTHIDADDPNADLSGEIDMLIGHTYFGGVWSEQRYALVRFNVGPADAGYVFISGFFSPGEPAELEIYETTSAWAESVTWNTMPTTGTKVANGVSIGSNFGLGWVRFEVFANNETGYLIKFDDTAPGFPLTVGPIQVFKRTEPIASHSLDAIRRPFFVIYP